MCVCFRERDDDDDDDLTIDRFSLLVSRRCDFRAVTDQMSCAYLLVCALNVVTKY